MKIDLRSDTITLPTEKMRSAMASAPVGDDVFQEDPTVRELEENAAERTGKQAALFLPSGTMSNLTAMLTHTHFARCGEVICEAKSHVRLNERGGMAVAGGLTCCPIEGYRGAMDPEKIRENIRLKDVHHPDTALICVEQTHNYAGGAVLPLENLAEIAQLAEEYDLPVHMDGARIFNAAAALKVPVSEITQYADSVTFCISKGLSAPVGAVLNGSAEFIELARYYRKMLGGGMRQAGILAAAGIVALDSMTDRLSEDNANAKALAKGLSKIDGIAIAPDLVDTNIVIFDVSGTGLTADEFADNLKNYGVLASTTAKYSVRFVTNRHVSEQDVPVVLDVVRSMLLDNTRNI